MGDSCTPQKNSWNIIWNNRSIKTKRQYHLFFVKELAVYIALCETANLDLCAFMQAVFYFNCLRKQFTPEILLNRFKTKDVDAKLK